MKHHRWIRAAGIAVCTLTLFAWAIARYDPWPDPLDLTVTLPPGPHDDAEPILATGQITEGDLLFIRYVGSKQVTFVYDCYAIPFLTSPVTVRIPEDRTLHLSVSMPSLAVHRGYPGHLRVACNGQVVFDTPAPFHVTGSDEVWTGRNAINSLLCRSTLHGSISPTDAVAWRRSVNRAHGLGGRIGRWVHDRPGQLFVILLMVGGVAGLASLLATSRQGRGAALIAETRRHALAMTIIALSAVCFAGAITVGSFDLGAYRIPAVFYEYQAESLLHGHIDVPEVALGGESFVVHGKFYGYFGPTPALLRVPLVVLGFPFGRLTQTYMLLYFIAALGGCYQLQREATRWVARESREPSGWATLVVLGASGLGSTVYFLGARAMMYHEAILCGIAFAVWSCWCTLRHLRQPGRRWWIGALVLGLLSLHARPPTGLFALLALAAAAVLRTLVPAESSTTAANETCESAGSPWRAWAICAAALMGVLTFNGLSYLKFGTFDGAPLRYNRLYTPERLARFGGRNFYLTNIPWGAYSYLQRPNFRLEPHFPYLFMTTRAAPKAFPEAKVDLPDYLLPIPYSMPALTLLAIVGAAIAAIRFRPSRLPLLVFWLAGIPPTLALFAAVAIAQRYSGDFCPLLISSAVFGIAAFDTPRGQAWRMVRWLIAIVTLFNVLITSALIFDYDANWAPALPPELRARAQTFGERIDHWVGSRRPRL